jgi:hypothetical protein
MRVAEALCAVVGALTLAVGAGQTGRVTDGPVDLAGKPQDPFHSTARARVFLFVRSDCPLTNRYAPELQRIATEFGGRDVQFWLVYPDPAETASGIENHIAQYRFPGRPLRDPRHQIVKRAQATIAPEAAVFDGAGRLAYVGRIDDRYVEFGKERPAARTHDLEEAIAAVLAGKPAPEPRTRAIGCFLADVK